MVMQTRSGARLEPELGTREYLVLRLGEVYREAALTDVDVSTSHLLVAVETVETPDRLAAGARLSALHSALRYAFPGGETIAAVSSRRLVTLAARAEPRLSESLARLRSELKGALSEGRLPGVRLWRHALPNHPDELPLALREVIG